MVNRVDDLINKISKAAGQEMWPEQKEPSEGATSPAAAPAAPAAAPASGLNMGVMPASALLLLAAMGASSGLSRAAKATAPMRLNTMARIKGVLNPSKLNAFQPWQNYLAQARAGFASPQDRKKAIEGVMKEITDQKLNLSAFDIDNIGRELKATEDLINVNLPTMSDKVLDFAGKHPWQTAGLAGAGLYGGTKAIKSIFGDNNSNRAGNKTVIL